MGALKAAELLASLRARHIEVTAEGRDIRIRAPRGALRKDERDALAGLKADLLPLLREQARDPAPDGALSLQQERLWYLDRVEGGLAAYNLSGAFQLDGPLDLELLEGALRAFVDRHELLRVVVREAAGKPRVESQESVPFSFESLTLCEAVGEAGTEDELRSWLEEAADQPLPLDRAPLIRFTLIRVSDDRHVLFLLVHHVVWDGRCFDVFLRDVGAFYEAALGGRTPDLPPLEAHFADYVSWQRAQVSGGRLIRAKRFWDGIFGSEHPTLDLPVEKSRPPSMTYGGDRVPIRFEEQTLAALRALARAEQGTVYLLLLTAFKALLYRYSRQEDLIVASPVEGRPLPRFEEMVGFFVNTLVIRSAPSDGLSFRDFHRQVRTTFLRAVDFQNTPFEWLVQQYARRDPSRSPLFQAMFTHQHTARRTESWGPVRVRSFPRGTRSATTDVGLWVREYEDYIDGGLDYRVDLFDRETMEGMARALSRLLETVLADPDTPLADLSLLSPGEEARETIERAGLTDASLPTRCYLDRLREHARNSPNRPVLRRADGHWMRWHELWELSGRVAGALGRHGVEPGHVVGLMVTRSEMLVPLLLGIHRAGAVYLPLDPDFPEARLEHMIRDSGARVAVVDDATVAFSDTDVALFTATEALALTEVADVDRPNTPGPTDLAYLIYTSGSTGVPKAVEVEHGALNNLLDSVGVTLGVGDGDTLVAVTTVSFDISLLELLLPLHTGGHLVVADSATIHEPRALERLLHESEATLMQATPATWHMLLDDGWDGTLRMALCGGETFPRTLADRLLDRAGKVWNLYGPTETTIWSTADRVDAEGTSVAVGRPLHNTRVYVLDEQRRPVPPGMRGEIWIAGAGLARGYRNRPELTDSRFVPDPFVAGERMYRTGDLGRWLGDGRLDHLGRIDRQVKINGFRIELGEIETALERFEEVRQAVVEAKGAEGDRRLVAYVSFDPGKSLLASEVRRRLAGTLPSFMLPGLVVEVDAFPLTPNGKIDRPALPDPIARRSAGRGYEAPRPGFESVIADVWRELLEVEQVGRHDNFFELGGHSLLSIRATVEVEMRSGRTLDARNFFFRSLAQLADTT